MNDLQFRQLLSLFGFSWEGYRRVRKAVKKRLVAHMQDLAIRDFESYLTRLQRDATAREACLRRLPVTLSRFFRDRTLWEALEAHVFLDILDRGSECVKVWSAGCGRGEEAYSFRILWEEQTAARVLAPQLLLWATDMSPENVQSAEAGLYSSSSLKEITDRRRSLYFSKTHSRNLLSVAASVRSGIHWRVLNHLIGRPPDQGFVLIFLRHSLLTYYQLSLQQPAFRRIHESLAAGGYLVVGTREHPPAGFPDLVRTKWHPHIYLKCAPKGIFTEQSRCLQASPSG